MSDIKAPETIYLQIGEECPNDYDFDKLVGVSWCEDKIYKNDISYILKSKYDLLLEENRKLKEEMQLLKNK